MTTTIGTSRLMAASTFFGGLARVFAGTGQRRNAKVLDARDLSDHLKRDLGFLDGQDFSRRQ